MSNWREQLSEEQESKAVVAWLMEYYHYPVLAFLITFAFVNRIRNWSNFVVDGEVYFRGNDPWYHFRSTEYAVNNGLSTQLFDPFTYFPTGVSPSQFGTIFDQLIALVALIVGLGNPSESLFAKLFLVAPPFFIIALCIPAYFMGRRLGDRFGGIVTVGFIAFAPDRLLRVSVAGFVDHHVAEALFMTLGVLGVMVALRVAERDRPVWELVEAREFGVLRDTIGWSLLAGVAVGLYLWTWPPGVLLYGILGVFFVIHLSLEHIRSRSPEHTAFIGVIVATTAGIMQLATLRTLQLSATANSLLQPGMGFALAGTLVFLAWLSREVESRDLSRTAYPGIIAGIGLFITLFTVFLLPDLFGFFYNQVDRVLGFITSPGTAAGTIGEAQPPERRLEYLYDRYHFAAATAFVGAAIIIGRQIIHEEPRSEELLVVIWGLFLIAATWTQVRFGYYLTVPIGALNAVVAGWVLGIIGTPDEDNLTIETYQILTIGVILLVLFVPIVPTAGGGSVPYVGADNTAVEQADFSSEPGSVLGWQDSLSWMEENTPEPGKYGNPDEESMEYFGKYGESSNHNYPDGSYGVLSWWDYGHWITTLGKRIPDANPFQNNADEAANFLLMQDEEEAIEYLEQDLDEGENAQTQYVMVDWKMAQTETAVSYRTDSGVQRVPSSGKFFAPVQFNDDYESSDFYTRLIANGITGTIIHKQPYYESMISRLYHYHGSAKAAGQTPAGTLVTQWRGPEGELDGSEDTFVQPVQDGPTVRLFQDRQEAEQFVEENEYAQLGGYGSHPPENVEALEHFRLVYADETSAINPEQRLLERGIGISGQDPSIGTGLRLVAERDARRTGLASQFPENSLNQAIGLQFSNTPSWTKTFERVPGAEIEGTVEGNVSNGTQVTLSTTLNPANAAQFQYFQRAEVDDDGTFSATVPYATTGYDEYGVEEGYTNTSVRAEGPYSVSAIAVTNGSIAQYQGSAEVPEGKVIGAEDPTVEVTLEETQTQDVGGEDGGDESTDGSTGESTNRQDSTDDQDSTDNETSGQIGPAGGTFDRSTVPLVG